MSRILKRKEWDRNDLLTNFMSGCACFYLLVLQLKKLSRELNSDDIIILSEGVIP